MTLTVETINMEQEIKTLITEYITKICSGDQASAEPLSDAKTTWLVNTLIIGICECYFEKCKKAGGRIVGIIFNNSIQIIYQEQAGDKIIAQPVDKEVHAIVELLVSK